GDIDEADHFIYDHPHDKTSVQNKSDDQVSSGFHSIIEREEDPEEVDHFIYGQPQQTSTPDPETPIENPVPIACDPPDLVFAVCNLNTSVSRDFEADEYRQIISKDEIDYDSGEEPKNTTDDAHAMQLLQTFGATTSQMSEAQRHQDPWCLGKTKSSQADSQTSYHYHFGTICGQCPYLAFTNNFTMHKSICNDNGKIWVFWNNDIDCVLLISDDQQVTCEFRPVGYAE
ncbi:hypothetical protein HAX54_017443, partial [Datura stramonium]|nr:hypothetical protein [Datura stramonium]